MKTGKFSLKYKEISAQPNSYKEFVPFQVYKHHEMKIGKCGIVPFTFKRDKADDSTSRLVWPTTLEILASTQVRNLMFFALRDREACKDMVLFFMLDAEAFDKSFYSEECMSMAMFALQFPEGLKPLNLHRQHSCSMVVFHNFLYFSCPVQQHGSEILAANSALYSKSQDVTEKFGIFRLGLDEILDMDYQDPFQGFGSSMNINYKIWEYSVEDFGNDTKQIKRLVLIDSLTRKKA